MVTLHFEILLYPEMESLLMKALVPYSLHKPTHMFLKCFPWIIFLQGFYCTWVSTVLMSSFSKEKSFFQVLDKYP